jgi:hypothetical protein
MVSRDCGPDINTPSHNTFFLLRHFDAIFPGHSGAGVEMRCDKWLGQKHTSKKGVRSTVERSDWVRIRLDTGKSGTVELMTRWSGRILLYIRMGDRVGTRRLGDGVGEAGEELQSDRVGLMSRREIERLRSRLELQSGLCFRVSGCSLDYASSAGTTRF